MRRDPVSSAEGEAIHKLVAVFLFESSQSLSFCSPEFVHLMLEEGFHLNSAPSARNNAIHAGHNWFTSISGWFTGVALHFRSARILTRHRLDYYFTRQRHVRVSRQSAF